MEKMKALVKEQAGKGIWMKEVPVPEIGINDVLIKIRKTAICGTDLHIYQWNEWARRTITPEMTIGHEYVGTIAEMGAGVPNLKIGQRVTGEGHIACGYCRNCRRGKKHVCENSVGVGVHRDGAFAEYISIPASNVVLVNKKIDDDVAAIFDPFGNATHTALSFPLIGEDVLITGTGLIGSMAVAISKFAGARYIVATDLNEYRLEIARKMGATRAINPTKVKISEVVKELGMIGFDVGLEMSGAPQAVNDMIRNMYKGGKIALLGLLPSTTHIPWDEVIFNALHLKGIYGREMFETWYKMEQMALSGLDITPVITHRFPAAGFQEAFDIMEGGQCGKIILDWQ